jgi:hypothetical protein
LEAGEVPRKINVVFRDEIALNVGNCVLVVDFAFAGDPSDNISDPKG